VLDPIKHLFDRARTRLAGEDVQRSRSIEHFLRLPQLAMRFGRIAEHTIRQNGDSLDAQSVVGFRRSLPGAMN
jgi:hypothetical protein